MRKQLRGAVLAVLIATLLAASVAGCCDTAEWELKGEVKFVELHESSDSAGAKTGTLDYSIQNTGRSTIGASSFAFTFATDRHRYHLSVVDLNTLKSGALLYGQVSIPYDSAEESGALANAVVDSVQFK